MSDEPTTADIQATAAALERHAVGARRQQRELGEECEREVAAETAEIRQRYAVRAEELAETIARAEAAHLALTGPLPKKSAGPRQAAKPGKQAAAKRGKQAAAKPGKQAAKPGKQAAKRSRGGSRSVGTVLSALDGQPAGRSVRELAASTGLNKVTVERAAEEALALKLVTRTGRKGSRSEPFRYAPTEDAAAWLASDATTA